MTAPLATLALTLMILPGAAYAADDLVVAPPGGAVAAPPDGVPAAGHAAIITDGPPIGGPVAPVDPVVPNPPVDLPAPAPPPAPPVDLPVAAPPRAPDPSDTEPTAETAVVETADPETAAERVYTAGAVQHAETTPQGSSLADAAPASADAPPAQTPAAPAPVPASARPSTSSRSAALTASRRLRRRGINAAAARWARPADLVPSTTALVLEPPARAAWLPASAEPERQVATVARRVAEGTRVHAPLEPPAPEAPRTPSGAVCAGVGACSAGSLAILPLLAAMGCLCALLFERLRERSRLWRPERFLRPRERPG